jgi:hypothetical protein
MKRCRNKHVLEEMFQESGVLWQANIKVKS